MISEFRDAEVSQQPDVALTKLANLFAVEQKLLELAEEQLGVDDVEVTNQYRDAPIADGGLLAVRLYHAGDYQRSEEVYRQTLSIARRRPGLALEEYNDLSWMALRAKRLADATPENRARYDAALGESEEAAALMAAMQYKKAAALYQEALPERQEVAGISPGLASEYNKFALAAARSEQAEAAEQAYRSALDMFELTIGKETARYSLALFNLAVLYSEQERLPEAEAAFLETRRIENRLGLDIDSQLATLDRIAGLYQKTQEPEKFNGIVVEYRLLERASHRGLTSLLRHLPLDAFLAASLDPAAILEDPALEHLPRELFQSLGPQLAGVDISKIQATLGFASLAPVEQGIAWGVMLKPIAGANLELQVPIETNEAAVGDFKYRKATDEKHFAACQAKLADGTLFMGSEAGLKQVLAMQNGDPNNMPQSKVGTRLRSQHGAGKLLLALDMAKIQLMAQAIASSGPALPPSLAPLKTLPEHLDSASLTVSLKESPYVTLQLQPRADSSVQNLNSIVTPALEFAQQELISGLGQQLRASGSEIGQPMLAYLSRVAQSKFNELAPVAESGQLVIRLREVLDLETAAHFGLLIPAIEGARLAAQQMSNSNNLKMIGLAMHNHHATYLCFPARRTTVDGKESGLSWRVHLLPFLEQSDLYQQFHLDEPWDSEHNKTLIEKMPAVFAAPGVNTAPGSTVYLTLAGPGTAMQDTQKVALRNITDGTSNTILVAEANPDQAVIWTKPDDLPFDPQQPLNGLNSARVDGIQLLFADGSVHLEPSDMDPKRMAALASIAGGEVIEGE
ncbi:hypothetical protein EC9_47750 [Rosistilla ulvae]|uniref:DUF1559 domain-containing protein n=1 Tax=Rosistilla ulvae TaxID=1930277 RepID=A0A517M6P7_9BACT|nr:DUF1559 domain-containing protein [Rosistilla ulvae]QDS90561.1 hypothetical protein EC9_47750 [Rosistilla ulvae]